MRSAPAAATFPPRSPAPRRAAALDLLGRDATTEVVVLAAKPPAPEVASRVLAAARRLGKPTVVWLLGASLPARRLGNLWFVSGSDEAAATAVALARGEEREEASAAGARSSAAGALVCGLFSGGTLAQEALLALAPFLAPLASNLKAPGVLSLATAAAPRHEILDLGADEYTRGRPHPMLDPTLVAERLRALGSEPTVGQVLLDVVLGDGAHPDPAALLAPAAAAARQAAHAAGRALGVTAILVGTDEDPQGLESQSERLRAAGCRVVPTVAAAVRGLLADLLPAPAAEAAAAPAAPAATPVPLAALEAPLVAVNVGLEGFHQALLAQAARAVHVDWRPPAGGDERLARILARSRGG